ncbi:dihydrolipoamide acetyltransferase family protein [Mycetocola sp. 2940]|uniref:dihydrolipoamide acetyltransferase family protein n=1 Tax=Mycetocola sp. 2940 TaxID=3156452 RepID=UPI0033971258
MHLLHLPKLGYTMETGSITGWLVAEGSTFDVGETLYEVETEKNVVEVEARLPGTLVRVIASSDEALDVGDLVAVVADPGEDLSPEDIDSAIGSDSHGDAVDDGVAEIPPSAETEAPGITSQLDAPMEGPAFLAASPSGRVRALPKVRAAADRLGVDLATVTGTGPRGSLTVEDVERAASTSAASDSGNEGQPAISERRTLTGVRKAMAAGVTKSWAEVPQFVQQIRVDMSAVAEYRAAKKAAGEPVGVTAVLAAAIAHAVQAVPEVNATLQGNDLLLYTDVNIAVAVSSDRGLVVPTVGGLQGEPLAGVEAKIQSVVAEARTGSLPTDVLPTITLSNLGGYGVETGMPLVTTPQAAIVFAGDIVDTPVVVDGQVEIRPLLGIAIGYDHRIVDGATGGEFCRALRAALEDPGSLETPARSAS